MATDPSLISFEHFVEAYRQHMSSLPGHTEVKIDATTRTLRYRFAGQVHGLDLTRAYADFRAGGRSLASFIEARTHSLPSRQSEGPRSLEEAGSRLLPMIRDRRYLGLAVLMAQVSAPTAEVPALPFRELAGALVVTLALDSETTIQTLAEADLAAWGVDFDTACERAIANLRRRGLPAMEELAPGLYGSRGGDPYAVSCLLLPELTSSLPLRGEAIASLPASDLLLLAGSQDSAALAAQAQLTANVIAEARRPLSAQLIRHSAQGWVTADQALSRHPALVRAGHVLLQRDYKQQAELLNALNQARGEDIFVASYFLGAKSESEPLFNYTQFTEGVTHALLPRADHLGFLTRAQELLVVPWSLAESVLGAALEPPAMVPARYRLRSFPDPAQLMILRDGAVLRQGPAAPEQIMAATAEDFRRAFEAQFGRQLSCDADGVRELEQIIEGQRVQFEAPPQKMLMGIAAVLGEILVRQFGATWISHKDGYAVRFEANSGVVPLERVARQWDKGGAGGNTLSALFETIRQRKAGANADARTQTPATQAVDAQAPQAASPAPSSRFRIAAQVPDTQMAQLIEKTRSKIAGLRQTVATGTLKRMRAENPTWVTYRDPLHEVSRQQDLLLAEGEVVWAALVMANQLLFQAGREDCPGLLVYSTDPYFDARPQELQAIARRIFELKNTVPEDPELRALARLVTEESDRGMGWRVPEALTDRDVRGSIFMAFRKHLPRGVLLGSRFPILVHATTPAVMFLPVEAWPPELVRSWKQGGDQRSFEDLRRLPEGLRVVIDPGVVTADLQRAAEYVWRFHTTVEALHAELTIVEFGCLRWIGGKWRAGVDGEVALGSAEFAERYARPGALLALGQLATDSTSEVRSRQLRSARRLFYFIGKDAAGTLFRGDAELELRGTLVPLDSAPPKEDKPSGGLAAISRLFGKKQSDELRFDGVYRTKFLPHDEADDSYCYLRLYPDGTALCMVSTDPPSEFARRFDQKNLAIAKGTHSVKGDTIWIEIRASEAAIEFTGNIERNRMLLSTRGFNNRPTGQDEFLFMGWRP